MLCSPVFETLQEAFDDGAAGMIECQIAATGEIIAVIAAFSQNDEGEVSITPFAMFFNGNPYEILNSPKPEGGFATQAEVDGTDERKS